LLNTVTKEVLAKGVCERIGIDGRIKYTPHNGEQIVRDIPMPTHEGAIRATTEFLISKDYGVIKSMDEIEAVGHRIVHGGEKFTESVLVTDDVIRGIDEVTPLAPLHNPASLIGIRACMDVMPSIPHVVVFDTAFHQTMPPKAYLYALPYEYYKKYAIRRYGFHGTSHRYVSGRAAEMLGRPIEELRLITCHLGNGSSIAAIQFGKVIDTSMGFTPLAGLPMGTRTGDIDPAIVTFIMEHENLTVAEMDTILNKESGVLGISGVSSDFRDLEVAAKEVGGERSEIALEMFEYSVHKWIGAYAAIMGGVDAVVFTAGVGENNCELRERVMAKFGFLGAEINLEKNKARGKECDISRENARVRTLVIPTNEELVIAMDTEKIALALKK
ncbi:MAG: acetate kinase, partial [Clostridia bacterium]